MPKISNIVEGMGIFKSMKTPPLTMQLYFVKNARIRTGGVAGIYFSHGLIRDILIVIT